MDYFALQQQVSKCVKKKGEKNKLAAASSIRRAGQEATSAASDTLPSISFHPADKHLDLC